MPEQLPQAIEAVIIEARQFLVDEIDTRRASLNEGDVDDQSERRLHREVREASKRAGFFQKPNRQNLAEIPRVVLSSQSSASYGQRRIRRSQELFLDQGLDCFMRQRDSSKPTILIQ